MRNLERQDEKPGILDHLITKLATSPGGCSNFDIVSMRHYCAPKLAVA